MNKTIFGKLGFIRMVLLVAMASMLYAGCGKTGLSPTSANDTTLNRNVTVSSVANVSTATVTATAGGAWVNTAFTAQTSDFTLNFDASVSVAPTNAIIGLSNGAQTAYASFGGLIRFNPSGDIDAYNGSIPDYAGPSTVIPYTAGTIYSFTVLVHMAAQTYDISVTSPGVASKVIGTGFKFRTAVSPLNNYGAFVSTTGGSGTLTVKNFNVVVPTPTSTPSFTPTATAIVISGYRVHAGGSAYTDSLGNVWAADEDFVGGTVGSISTSPVAGTSDPTLYQTQRYGNPFSYSFPLANGSYQVTLKFMENKFTAPGGRVFDVAINGSTVLSNFDIYAVAGAENKALDEVFNNVTVTGGVMTINLGPATANNAKIDAIQIVAQSAVTPVSTSTFTNTATITNTPTWTNTPTNTSTATNTFTATSTSTPTNTFTITNTPTSTNTFTKTATPVPPTATPTSQPSLNINFSQWYLQEPSGSGNSPTTRANTWLEAGNSDTYFNKAADGWQAFVDVNPGITTSGSQHPRCEMHEETTWGTGGTNTMTITGKITKINGDTTTIGQIFNNNEGTLIEMQYSKSAAQFKVFYEEVKGSGGYPTQTYVSWPMDTTYTYKLSLSGGVAQVTINGQVVFTHTLSSSVSGDQFYFKAGNYDQSAMGTTITDDVSTTPYSIVEIGTATIVHK